MTPIQQSVIPYLIQGKDVMGCAQTGSGKTVSFLAPIINKMLQDGPPKEDTPSGISSPIGIILAPTRELAEQIYKEARKLVYKTGILVVKVYGGVPIDTQIRHVTSGCDIIVATPGRLIDFMGRRLIRLSQIQFLVFDEADRMLEMGFEDQLREIIFSSDIPEKQKRINMMFSATFTPQVREIARSFMNEFYFVTSDLDDEIKVNENIEQTLIYAEEEEKVIKLHDILQKIRGSVISKYLLDLHKYNFYFNFLFKIL
jgi:superfamily II DNA/RNA helicase